MEVARAFDANYRFSPSQLETYLSCPFQFFSKYVFDLKPVDDRDELDEDLTQKGSRIHDILENFETFVQQQAADSDLTQIAASQIDHAPSKGSSPWQRSWTAACGKSSVVDWVARWNCTSFRAGLSATRRGAVIPYRLEFAFGEAGTDHPE